MAAYRIVNVDQPIVEIHRLAAAKPLTSNELVSIQCILAKDDPRRRRMDRHVWRMKEIGQAIRGLGLSDDLGQKHDAFLDAEKANIRLWKRIRQNS